MKFEDQVNDLFFFRDSGVDGDGVFYVCEASAENFNEDDALDKELPH